MDKSEIAYDTEKFRPKAVVTSDECYGWCGAGGMVIACANVLINQGYNPQKHMIAVCTDIDEVAARMCYLQLALLGVPAIVNIGNSLTLEVRQTLYTPMLMLNPLRFKSFFHA